MSHKGILAGVPVSRLEPQNDQFKNYLVIACTEINSDQDFERICYSKLNNYVDPYQTLGVSKDTQLEEIKNRWKTLAMKHHPDRLIAQGMPQDIIENNTYRYYQKRYEKIKSVNSRSIINHFAFHLSNPLTIFIRNIALKYLTKNKKFLENYLGKIYKN